MTPLDDALDRLERALQILEAGLASGEPARVLHAETALSDAVVRLRAGASRAPVTGEPSARTRLANVSAALERCRALGDAARLLTGSMFPAPAAYGRAGAITHIAPVLSQLSSRT